MPPGPLIGRDVELAEVTARVRAGRLVTIVGPGGVGKTALADGATAQLAGEFPLGVRRVDLTRVDASGDATGDARGDDGRAVRGALAGQLGFDSFDALLSSPGDQPVLLVLDNCEHVLDAVADAVSDILGACLQPVVLATSRSPLEVPGESIVSLAPLGLPAAHDDPLGSASVRLFLQRCRDAGAAVDTVDAELVAELCRRLDGLPLALEIAAARSRSMSIAEIAERLAAGDDVLDRPRYRGAPRHRSVADTIRWSFDLLPPATAAVLEEVAVFAGPFTAASAAAIAEADVDSEGVAPHLDELVHASLLVVDPTSTPTRYQMLDTVRRFALDRLGQRRRLDSVYDRYVDHVLRAAVANLAGSTTSWRQGLMRELVAAFDDLSEALRWCIAHDSSSRRAYTLCGILWTVVHQAHADDIAHLARRTMERWPPDGSQGAAQATSTWATAEYVTGRPELAVDLASRAIELHDGGLAAVTLRRVLGQARRALGDDDGSIEAFGAGAAAAERLGMTAMGLELEVAAAQVRVDAAATTDLAAAVDAAAASLHDVVRRADAVGSAITSCWARTTMGWLLLRVDPVAARPIIDAALTEARDLEYPIAIATGLRSRAYGELLSGDTRAATATVVELLGDLLDRGALSNVRIVVDVAAALAHRLGHPAADVLAATARALPITTLASAQLEMLPLPHTAVVPLPRHQVVSTVRDVLAELVASTAATAPQAAATLPAASIVRRGDSFDIEYGGHALTVRASKGVVDIVALIAAGGREIHCLDLAGAGVEQASTGEVIDAAARRQYEQRIRDLQDEIEEAEQHNDHARAYRYQVELDTILDHLTAALGAGSRTRQAADNAERARSAVTHRVRATVRQLAKLHPSLGRHLAHAIVTGTYCSYRPEVPTSWTVE